MPTRQTDISGWVKRALREEPPRSKSLLVTIFGDSIKPYASGIWLSDLIALLRPFQVNERLVRTSAFRLGEEGWLDSRRDGRRSRYSLTPSGRQRVEHASHRIYDPPPDVWDGSWTFLIQNKSGNPVSDRAELRRELEWEGFGVLGQGIFVHPCADPSAVHELLDRLQLAQSVMVMQVRDLGGVTPAPSSRLASECWNLHEVATQYEAFLKRFGSIVPLLSASLTPLEAFVIQTLLIHSFRRVTLHDPRLPAVLLPAEWPGHAALKLSRHVYQVTWKLTNLHLAQHLEHDAGSGLKPSPEFLGRFGGLKTPPARVPALPHTV